MFIKSRLQPAVLLSIIWSAATFAQESSPLPLPNLNSEISVPDSVTMLMAQISEVEQSQDSFDLKLGELSFELGLQLSAIGLTEEALAAFHRSDQNMKINQGLYSENREIFLRKIQEQHIEMQNWEAAEQSLEMLAWIKARNYDTQSLDYVAPLQEMIAWNLAIDYYQSSYRETNHLLSAHDDLEDIYAIYENNEQPIDTKTAELAIALNHRMALRDELTPNIGRMDSEVEAYRQVVVLSRSCQQQHPVDLEQANNCARAGEREIRSKTRELNYGVSENQSLSNTQQPVLKAYLESLTSVPEPIDNSVEYDYDPAQLFFSRSYTRGRDLLMSQFAAWRVTGDSTNTLQALLNLADWYLLFGYQETAEGIYATAWTYAERENMTDQMQMLSPLPLSINGLVEEFPLLGSGNNEGVADFALIINIQGKVERIEVIQSNIADAEVLARLTAEISMSRYRPILREGLPIAMVAHSVTKKVLY